MVDKNFVSKAIYSSITMIAVLLIMEDHPPTAWAAAITLFGTVFVVAIAETYCAPIAEIIAGQKKLNRKLSAIWHHSRPIFITASIGILIGLVKFLFHEKDRHVFQAE